MTSGRGSGQPGPVISALQLTPTHDGEAACMVELMHPGGGRSVVQLDSLRLARVMAAAEVEHATGLVGRRWEVLLQGMGSGVMGSGVRYRLE